MSIPAEVTAQSLAMAGIASLQKDEAPQAQPSVTRGMEAVRARSRIPDAGVSGLVLFRLLAEAFA